MAVYQPVHTKIWSDEWFDGLKAPAKLLFLYFLTTPANTPSGIFQCSLKRMSFDTALTPRQCQAALSEMSSHVRYDADKAVVWVVNAIRYWPSSPNVLRAVEKELAALDRHPFVSEFAARHPETMAAIRRGLETPTKPLPNPLPTPERERDQREGSERERNERDMGGTRARGSRAAPPSEIQDRFRKLAGG